MTRQTIALRRQMNSSSPQLKSCLDSPGNSVIRVFGTWEQTMKQDKGKAVQVKFISNVILQHLAYILLSTDHLTGKPVWCQGISKSERSCQTHNTFREGGNSNQINSERAVLQTNLGQLQDLSRGTWEPGNAPAKLHRASPLWQQMFGQEPRD